MGLLFLKVDALPPPTFDVGKFGEYPHVQDLIFSFLDFEIKPDGLEPIDLAAIPCSSPVDLALALWYCRRVNYFLCHKEIKKEDFMN